MSKYTFELNPDAEKLLQSLTEVKRTTKAQILRNALVLYNYLLKECDKGHTVSITKGDEIKKDVVIS